MKKKIIITGGLGYIGSELCKLYSGVSWHHKIIVIDNRFISERVNQIRNWNIDFIHGDILNKELIIVFSFKYSFSFACAHLRSGKVGWIRSMVRGLPCCSLRHGFRYPEFPHGDLIENKLNFDVAVRVEMTLERVPAAALKIGPKHAKTKCTKTKTYTRPCFNANVQR